MSLVSVVIPTYNQPLLLRDAIKGVLSQTFADFELLIIDDGSTDDTASAVRGFGDPRIHYFYKKNKGHASSRNFGLQKARGAYVALLDHDDLWAENYLEVMIQALSQNPEYGMAYGRARILHPNGYTEEFAKEDRYVSGWVTLMYFKGGPCIMPSATVFRKKDIANFYFDESFSAAGEDNDFFMRFSLKAPFLFVPEAVVYRREIPDSLSKRMIPNQFCDGVRGFERFCYSLGGRNKAHWPAVRKAVSRKYRRAAKYVAKSKYRKAAICLIKKAMLNNPFDLRLYVDFVKYERMDRNQDPAPDWVMPGPLPERIKVTIYE